MVKYLKCFLFFSAILWGYSCIEDVHKTIFFESPDCSFIEVYTVVNDSIKDGEYFRYYENGKLNTSCYYEKGSIEGIKKRYSDKGDLVDIETYCNGIMNGSYTVFYPNGSIKLKQIFVDDVLQGISYGYYQNGNLREKVNIKNGFENGAFEEYYPSGVLHWKGKYLSGEYEHDTLFEYNQSGHLMRKLFCQMGFCKTIWRSNKKQD